MNIRHTALMLLVWFAIALILMSIASSLLIEHISIVIPLPLAEFNQHRGNDDDYEGVTDDGSTQD